VEIATITLIRTIGAAGGMEPQRKVTRLANILNHQSFFKINAMIWNGESKGA
jgi:hypothetical protein